MSTETKKRWLTVLPQHQIEWVRDTAEETGMRGSDIISELVERVMRDGTKQFKASLAAARTRKALQDLADKKAAIEAEVVELQRKLKE